MTIRALLAAASVVFLPATAVAQDWAYFPPASVPTTKSITLINLQLEEQLKVLRKEGLALQRADGGILTPAHRIQLQAKLDNLWEYYRNKAARADPWR